MEQGDKVYIYFNSMPPKKEYVFVDHQIMKRNYHTAAQSKIIDVNEGLTSV